MFSPMMRLALGLVGCVAGALSFLNGRWLLGSAYLIATLLLIRGHRRSGAVWLAFRAFRRREMSRVKELLGSVDHPERLDPRYRAYFDWMAGVLAADEDDFEVARSLLTRAVEGPLRTDKDRSVVHFHIAEIARFQEDVTGARHHLEEARRLTRSPEMLELIVALEQQFPS